MANAQRNLARRLIAAEAARASAGEDRPHEAVRVCEKLRIALTRFAGADGFAALLRRSLALARAEVPALSRITIKQDCSIDGLESLATEEADGGVEAMAALTTHLLALLVTFIGEPLTLRLLREAWPDELMDESHGQED